MEILLHHNSLVDDHPGPLITAGEPLPSNFECSLNTAIEGSNPFRPRVYNFVHATVALVAGRSLTALPIGKIYKKKSLSRKYGI
jgi:hypothetical protein